MRISDWSSDVCSSDLCGNGHHEHPDHSIFDHLPSRRIASNRIGTYGERAGVGKRFARATGRKGRSQGGGILSSRSPLCPLSYPVLPTRPLLQWQSSFAKSSEDIGPAPKGWRRSEEHTSELQS